MKESRKIVLKETGFVAIGMAICTAIMLGLFALLHQWSLPVWLGALVGYVLSVANFFFTAVGATLAADRAVEQDVTGGKKIISASMGLRFVVLIGILCVCYFSGYFNMIALLLPLGFAQPVLTIGEFFRK